MDQYDRYTRRSPDLITGRDNARERDDYRSHDTYRDRRRSPERRRERRRSRSPANIDRYQPDRVPRDDYRPARDSTEAPRRHVDSRRQRPSPERSYSAIDRYVPSQESPPLPPNPLADPMKLDIQVGFNWFAEWWRYEQRLKEKKERDDGVRRPIKSDRENREEKEAERSKIQVAYDKYKEDLQKSQATTFVRLHKDEDWFRERYVPEVRDIFRAKLGNFRETLYTQFVNDLNDGTFDEFTLEGIYKTESNGQGGVVEKEEGETVAAAEVLGTGDLLPTRGGDLRDIMSSQPTLLLKTIAPTVSREKLEAFAKEHLGTESDGFRHLSLSDPNPLKKCHRMGWIILKQNPEEPDEDIIEEDVNLEEGEAPTTTKRKSTAERGLEKINGKTIEDPERANFTVHCGVHRPPETLRKKALWDLFSAPERVKRDLELVTRLVRKLDNELGDEIFGAAKIEERVMFLHESGQLQSVRSAKEKDFDIMLDPDEDEEEGAIEDEDDDLDMLIDKKKLDVSVEYLRRVYNFCFFCVFESDSVHELQRKCAGGHLRRPRASLTTAAKEVARASAAGEPFPLQKGKKGDEEFDLGAESPESRNKLSKPNNKNALQLQRAFNWVSTYEEKILQILEPENVDLKKLGGVPLEEGVEEELKKYIQQDDPNKFRCLVPDCSKMFKAEGFWRKHLKTRHADFYDKIYDDIKLVNTYVRDPSHIAPSRSDANSNGHFPIGNNGVLTGTPRGFSLQAHLAMGFPPGMIMPGGMPTYGPPGSATNPITHVVPGFGPVRSAGRGASHRSAGPYTRPDNPRNNNTALIPGRSVVSGFQSIHGRPLRSYEDLDAVNNKPATELDY